MMPISTSRSTQDLVPRMRFVTELRTKKILKKNKVQTYIRRLPFALWACLCDKENKRVFVYWPLAFVDLLFSQIHIANLGVIATGGREDEPRMCPDVTVTKPGY